MRPCLNCRYSMHEQHDATKRKEWRPLAWMAPEHSRILPYSNLYWTWRHSAQSTASSIPRSGILANERLRRHSPSVLASSQLHTPASAAAQNRRSCKTNTAIIKGIAMLLSSFLSSPSPSSATSAPLSFSPASCPPPASSYASDRSSHQIRCASRSSPSSA